MKEPLETLGYKESSSFFAQYIALTKKEIKIQFRYPINILSLFLMNFLIIAVFAIVFLLFVDGSDTSSGGLSTNSVATYMFWGFLSYNIFSDSMFTIGNSMRLEQTTGTLETLFLHPVHPLANLLSKISFGLSVNVLVGVSGFFVIQELAGKIIFKFPEILLTIGIFFLLAIQMYGLAFIIAGLSIKLKESILPLVNFGQFAFLIFSAFFTPFMVLGSLVLFSYFIPISYTIDLLRSSIFDTSPELVIILINSGLVNPSLEPSLILIQWLIVISFTFALPVVGYKYFTYAINVGRSRGDLTDY